MEATTPGTFTGCITPKQSACPPWCVADHDDREAFSYPQTHHSATFRVSPAKADFGRWIAAEVLTNDSDLWRIGQVVFLNANSMGRPQETWPHLFLTPRNARSIADIVAILAAATPEQHRDLAKGIRDCAALISDEDASGGPA